MAAGLFNQRLHVVPSRETVVVRFGQPNREWSGTEFLARLLDGRTHEASTRRQAAQTERVTLITNLRMQQLDRTVGLTEAQEAAIRSVVQRKMRILTEIRGQWARRGR
jgi:hypothetical protein